MSIIHLIIIGYTLSLLYVLKNLVLGSLRLYALKHNLGIDPNDLKGLERIQFSAENDIPITYSAALFSALFSVIGYSVVFGVLYFVVSLF